MPTARSASESRREPGNLQSFVFYDGLLATIVATFATHGVVDVPCAAVGADSDGRSYSFVVCATLCGAGLGLFSFRMCHWCMSLTFFFNYNEWRLRLSPARCAIACCLKALCVCVPTLIQRPNRGREAHPSEDPYRQVRRLCRRAYPLHQDRHPLRHDAS